MEDLLDTSVLFMKLFFVSVMPYVQTFAVKRSLAVLDTASRCLAASFAFYCKDDNNRRRIICNATMVATGKIPRRLVILMEVSLNCLPITSRAVLVLQVVVIIDFHASPLKIILSI